MMGKINRCLKNAFIIFNVVFVILGAVVTIGVDIILRVGDVRDQPAAHIATVLCRVSGGFTTVIALLGVYGAYKEKKVPLILFLTASCLSVLGLLCVGILAAVVRPKLNEAMESAFQDISATKDHKSVIDTLQYEFKCCGMFSYEEWGSSIPDSCICRGEAKQKGLCQRVGNKQEIYFGQEIYKQTCFPIFMHTFSLSVDIFLGVVFGFMSCALLGVVLSSIMIHQVSSPASSSPLGFNLPTLHSQPPKYTRYLDTETNKLTVG